MQRSDQRYQAALEHLFDRINYEKSTDRPYNKNHFKLDRMVHLLELLGNPQLSAPVIHIAGTKGKGSVSWLLAEAFRRNGLKTGLYTSPHLVDLEERFVVDGQPISPAELVEIVDQLRQAEKDCSASPHGQPTFFEMTTAIGWVAFKLRKTQVNVIEVGLGGRLDSTNVCLPALSIITSISYDHQQQLGESLAEIAGEKAGIIKPDVPVVSGARASEASRVIEQIADRQGSQLSQLGRDFEIQWRPDRNSLQADLVFSNNTKTHKPTNTDATDHESKNYSLKMLGKHQADNAAIAIASWRKLQELDWNLNDESLAYSLANTQVPARLEILSKNPYWILDSAHNQASIDALADALECYFPLRPKSVIFACSKDKKASEMLDRLCKFADRIILTQFHSNPRFTPVDKLLEIAQNSIRKTLHNSGTSRQSDRKDPCEILAAESLEDALVLSRQPLANGTAPTDTVRVITGSFFIAAEAKSILATNILEF